MLECISFAHKSDGSDYVEFKIYVQNENQQRMIIGTKGRNISWVIDHFKVQYAKLYKKEVTIEVRVVIKANIGGREELLLEERWLKKN